MEIDLVKNNEIILLKECIENAKPFAAQNGRFLSAPFKNFSVDKKLLKHFMKNLIGSTGLGQPKVVSAVKTAGVPIVLDWNAIWGVPIGGVGVELLVITPELSVAQSAITAVYNVVPGVISHTLQFIPTSKQSKFTMLAAYANSNEVWPIAQANPTLTIADGAIADGSSVMGIVYDLSDDNVKNLVKEYSLEQ